MYCNGMESAWNDGNIGREPHQYIKIGDDRMIQYSTRPVELLYISIIMIVYYDDYDYDYY